MIVLFGGEKGGAGKTTLATNISTFRTNKQQETLLVDADKQSTSCFCISHVFIQTHHRTKT